MTTHKHILKYICILAISLLLPTLATAQNKKVTEVEETDSTAFFNGFAVSGDLVGLLQLGVGDYGQFEAALRINLKDRWFPIFELGYGKGKHNDEVTLINCEAKAPYGRIGCDFNLLKNKHDIYRFYIGARYAYTNFKSTFTHPGVPDPKWGGDAKWEIRDVASYYHWAEFVIGVDASVMGPIHLGWSVRYKKRLAYNVGDNGNAWYVPGFGLSGSTRLGGTFNVIIDI